MSILTNNYMLNKVFSQNTLKEILKNGDSDILDTAYASLIDSETTSIALKNKFYNLYSILKKDYRNEYFYKNTMINKLLLGRHSVNTTLALSEIPLGKSKADLVLINGKAVVYEIKTELDSLDRLDNQIQDYYKVFDYVEIITDESHFNKIYEKYAKTSVGISILTKKNTISQKKKPERYTDLLNHTAIYKVLRKKERQQLVSFFYNEIPEFDQFSEYREIQKLFCEIDMEKLYVQFLKELKKRNNMQYYEQELQTIPYELKSLIYFSSFKKKEFKILKNSIEEVV